jgi:hypothetical protein
MMPMAVLAANPRALVPALLLVVSCDRDHGFLPCTARFRIDSAHSRAPALRAGWKITGEDIVLCPAHAAKGAP